MTVAMGSLHRSFDFQLFVESIGTLLDLKRCSEMNHQEFTSFISQNCLVCADMHVCACVCVTRPRPGSLVIRSGLVFSCTVIISTVTEKKCVCCKSADKLSKQISLVSGSLSMVPFHWSPFF